MKTHLINQAYKQQNNNASVRKRTITAKDNYENNKNNNTYNTHRPAEAISFSGSVGSISKKAINGFVNSKSINGLIEKVYDNEAAFNAVYALIVAGMLKPLVVLHMPGSEEKDKQIVATKNFLQAFLGFFLSYTIGGGFIKKAVDIVDNDIKMLKIKDDKIEVISKDSKEALELAKSILVKEKNSFSNKYEKAKKEALLEDGFNKAIAFSKAMLAKDKTEPTIEDIHKKADTMVQDFVKNRKHIFENNANFSKELKNKVKNAKSETEYIEAFRTFWKNSTGAPTSILKAKISSALLPAVMAFLFAKKNLEKAQKAVPEKEDFSSMLKRNTNFKTEEEYFHKLMNSKNPNFISFKGNLLQKGIEQGAKLIEQAGMSKGGEKIAKGLSYAKKPSARMADIESIAITTYWLQNTARSKKIDPSQKLGLNIHTALVTLVSSSLAFILDYSLDDLIKKVKETYSEKIKEVITNTKQKNGDLINTNIKNNDNIPAIVQMAIKENYKNIAKNNSEINDKTCLEVLNKIKQIPSVEKAIDASKTNGFDINKDVIKNSLNNFKQTEPLKDALKENCKNLLGSKLIAESLSEIDLNDAKAVEKQISKLSESYGKKLNKFKSLSIFTIVVRFLVPVLMVPISGKLKKKVVEHKDHKNNNRINTLKK